MGALEFEAGQRRAITRRIRELVKSVADFRHLGTGWEWWLEIRNPYHLLILRRSDLDPGRYVCYRQEGLVLRVLAESATPDGAVLAGLRTWAQEQDQLWGKVEKLCSLINSPAGGGRTS